VKLLITAILLAGAIQIPTIIVPQYSMETLIDSLSVRAEARVPLFKSVTRRSVRVFYHLEGTQKRGYWGAWVTVFWDGGQAFEVGALKPDDGLREYIDPFQKRD